MSIQKPACLMTSYNTLNGIYAGTGWLTEGGSKYVRILQKAVKEGRLSPEILRDNARYTIGLVLKKYKA